MSPVVRLESIDVLETALVDRWADVSQATYRFLALLRAFDFRQGWKAYGCNDCAGRMYFTRPDGRPVDSLSSAEDQAVH